MRPQLRMLNLPFAEPRLEHARVRMRVCGDTATGSRAARTAQTNDESRRARIRAHTTTPCLILVDKRSDRRKPPLHAGPTMQPHHAHIVLTHTTAPGNFSNPPVCGSSSCAWVLVAIQSDAPSCASHKSSCRVPLVLGRLGHSLSDVPMCAYC